MLSAPTTPFQAVPEYQVRIFISDPKKNNPESTGKGVCAT
jgi:hypothetical protein